MHMNIFKGIVKVNKRLVKLQRKLELVFSEQTRVTLDCFC